MSAMTEEEYCHEMLSLIRKDYERAAKPFIDRLVRIHCSRPQTLIIEYELAAKLGIAPAQVNGAQGEKV